MVAGMFWSWLYLHTPFFEENVGVVRATVGKATSIFTAGTYFHLGGWNTNFCAERLSEMVKVVGVYFQVNSIYS